MATSDDSLWLVDEMLPLLVRVDRATGEAGEPVELPRPPETSGSASGACASEDAVWIRFNDRLARFDIATGRTWTRPMNNLGIAADTRWTWVLPGDGHVGRLPAEGGELTLLGYTRPRSRSQIQVGHGAVWTVSWDVENRSSLVERVDPETGLTETAQEIEGTPQRLAVDRHGVWLSVWRHRGTIEGFVIRIEPGSGVQTGEVELEANESTGPIVAGTLWTIDEVIPVSYGTNTVRAIDIVSGRIRNEIEVTGHPTWVGSSETTIFARLLDHPASSPRLVELDASGGQRREIDLSGLDISAYLPPRPGKIDAAETERKLRDRVATALFGGWFRQDPETGEKTESRPYIEGVEFEVVRLEGTFPTTEVVAYFRSEAHRGVVFGRRRRIWEDNGALSGVVDVMDVNLMEDVEACGYGLPDQPEPDESGIVWF